MDPSYEEKIKVEADLIFEWESCYQKFSNEEKIAKLQYYLSEYKEDLETFDDYTENEKRENLKDIETYLNNYISKLEE